MGIRISEMEEATTFGADDYVPIVTNGTNKKALGAKIKDFIAGFFATKNGDNITDDSAFRSAIGISAANTPFDNAGTGMTAEDVQAGIEELNTSKANIDGSNIANPSAFRQNIDINKVFYSTGSIATDLNDCKAGGIYRTNRSTVNTPTSNYYVVLTLVFNENSDLSQLAIDVNFATLFVRSFHDGTTWTAWKRCDNV